MQGPGQKPLNFIPKLSVLFFWWVACIQKAISGLSGVCKDWGRCCWKQGQFPILLVIQIAYSRKSENYFADSCDIVRKFFNYFSPSGLDHCLV